MCLVTLAVPSFAAVTTNIVCADEGLKDFTSTSWSWTHDPFTFTVDKQGGGNNPVFNTNFNDLRVYAKGTFTIKAKSAMTKVVFNLSSQGMKRLAPITASNGTIAKQALGDNTVTWTGDAEEVTFTVGDKANYGSEGGEKAGQFDFTSFAITVGSDYTPLAYIECTGGRRENAFVTDYVPSTPTTVGVGFQQTGDNGWAGIFSARNVGAGTGISLYANGDNTHLGYFTGGTTGAGDNFVENYDNRARYDVVAHTTYLKWTKAGEEEKTKETGNETMNETSRCLAIFANPEWDNAFKGRIYYLNIEDGEVNYAYKPVMRHDGVYGYLDATSGKFVTPKEGNYDNYTYGVLEDKPIVAISTLAVELKEGKTATVTVEGAKNLTWTSSDTNVATVENGVITGVAEGDCTVTCTTDELGGWEFTIKVSVRGIIDYTAWDGTSEAILPSARHTGDAGKAAYTKVFNSEKRYGDADKNKIWGTPENDAEGKQWFEADYNVEAWDYTTNVLPNGWCDNDIMGDVYARRYFKANGDLTGKTVYMPAPHDDSPCEYYINGTLVWQRTGTEPGDGWYEDEVVRLTDEQKALIKTDGSLNVFAFHVHQNWGGRYADGGLYIDGQPKNWFEGDGNRRRLEAAIAQLEAEGKTVPEEAKNATNYRQDAGRYLDLVRYAPRLEAGKHDYSAVASAKAADGLECWIYNVGAGKFLAGGNDWGTHMSLNPALSGWPMVLHANTSGANRYTIQSNLPNGLRGKNDGMGHNGYVDCSDWNTTDEGWAWEFEEVGNGNYRIINSGNSGTDIYLGMTEDRRLQVDTNKSGADNVFNQWKLFTRAELDALWTYGTEENPADVSFMIHQNAFSQRDFDGDDIGKANSDLNDSKWERNAGSIWDWKNNGADGDYVFEMWNTSGDVYLKQTVEGLRPGKYIVGCQGYYRDGDYNSAMAGNNAQLAYLYAGTQDNKVALPSILDYANKGYGYGNTSHMDKLIPDDCAEAAHFFQMGCYKVQVEVEVGEDGVLELGVFRGGEGVKDGDWIVVDNFTLSYCSGETLPSEMYLRHDQKWGGEKMEEAADSQALNKHFTWKGYTGTNTGDGAIFNFTLTDGGSGDACWGPTEKTYVKPGETSTNFGNYGDNCYVFQNQTAFVKVDAYLTPTGNKVVFNDYTLEAMADKDALYVVGEQTTGWSRESSKCQKLEKTEAGVYEGTIEVLRDNTIFDAIRLVTVVDNGENDNYIGLANAQVLGDGTYNLLASNSGRVYLRKGKVHVKVDFNKGTLETYNEEVEPSYVYAVGTLVDATWQNTNTLYTLTEVKPNVFSGTVKVAEDGDSRFSLFAERTTDDWNTGRFGPADESIRPEWGVPTTNPISLGEDRAWKVPAGTWNVTLDLNNGSFLYEDVAPEPLVVDGLAALKAIELGEYEEVAVAVKVSGDKITYFHQEIGQGFLENEDAAISVGVDGDISEFATGKALTGVINGYYMNMGSVYEGQDPAYILIAESFDGEATDADVSKGREIVEPTELMLPENDNRLVTVENSKMCPIVNEEGMLMIGDVVVFDIFYALPDDYVWPENVKSVTGVMYRGYGQPILCPRFVEDIVEGEAAPKYLAIGETIDAGDEWGPSEVSGIRNIDVESYNNYMIIRGFMGAAGYDLKVDFEEEDVTGLTPIINGVEGEKVTEGTLKMETGNAEFPYAEFSLTPEMSCGYVCDDLDGFALLLGSFINAEGTSTDSYYFLVWPQSGDLLYTVDNGIYDAEDEAFTDMYEMIGQHSGNIEVYDDNSIIIRKWAGVEGYDMKLYCAPYGEEETPEPFSGEEEEGTETWYVKYIASISDGVESAYEPMDFEGFYLTPVRTGLDDWNMSVFASFYPDNLKEATEIKINHATRTGSAHFLGFYFCDGDINLKSDNTALFLKWPGGEIPEGITDVTDSTSDDARFNIAGQRIKDSFKGIVIQNGKKFLKK